MDIASITLWRFVLQHLKHDAPIISCLTVFSILSNKLYIHLSCNKFSHFQQISVRSSSCFLYLMGHFVYILYLGIGICDVLKAQFSSLDILLRCSLIFPFCMSSISTMALWH